MNVVVAKGQNVHSSGHRAAKDACFTVLRMAEKTATQKWHFQHRDRHATQKVVSDLLFIKKYCPDLFEDNFDVELEGNWILEK